MPDFFWGGKKSCIFLYTPRYWNGNSIILLAFLVVSEEEKFRANLNFSSSKPISPVRLWKAAAFRSECCTGGESLAAPRVSHFLAPQLSMRSTRLDRLQVLFFRDFGMARPGIEPSLPASVARAATQPTATRCVERINRDRNYAHATIRLKRCCELKFFVPRLVPVTTYFKSTRAITVSDLFFQKHFFQRYVWNFLRKSRCYSIKKSQPTFFKSYITFRFRCCCTCHSARAHGETFGWHCNFDLELKKDASNLLKFHW